MHKSISTACALVTLTVSSVAAQSFDRETTTALKACHDHIWTEVSEFKDLPNAAVSVFPGIFGEDSIIVFWNIMWDDPKVRAAGNCVVDGDQVKGFEDYTKG